MNTEKPVEIEVRALQSKDGVEIDNIVGNYQGKYIEKANAKFLLYDEYYEGSNEPVKTMVKIGCNELTIIKKGVISTKMLLKVGEEKGAEYETPYGGMRLETKASNMTFTQNEDSMDIDVDYILKINGEHMADCMIGIRVRDKIKS